MFLTLTLIACSALAPGVPQPSPCTWAPPELRDARFNMIGDTDRAVLVERATDRVRLLIRATPSSPVSASRRIPTSGLNAPLEAVPFSAMPFGRQLICPRRPGSLSVWTVGTWESVHLSMDSPLVREGRNGRNRPDDLASEGRWAEAIARKAFAAYASRRLGPAETISVNGRSVALRKAEKSNAEMVDLEAWASATGASLTRDPNGDAWTLVRGGVSRLFALGADKVKVGTVWKPMPDAPMLKDGRVFVPRDGLSN